jgi:hypothetical protein
MGRSFESVRMGVKDVSARWLKASRALKKVDQVYGQKLAEMAKRHSSEAFYALDDPLEAAVFSVLLELVKQMDKADNEKEIDLTFPHDPDLHIITLHQSNPYPISLSHKQHLRPHQFRNPSLAWQALLHRSEQFSSRSE